MKELRIEGEAEEELWHAVDWYESERPNLGREFWAEVQKTLDSIQQNPLGSSLAPHIPERLRVRRRLTNRFPFAVFYLDMRETIHVLAIAHCHRRPGYWRDRLRTM